MTEEHALLQAIFADPHDQMSRLVFADWLDERGDPRAEYVRLLVRLDHMGIWTRLGKRTRDELEALRKKHDWVLHVGIPMSWQESLQRSVAETIAWCERRVDIDLPEGSTRSEELLGDDNFSATFPEPNVPFHHWTTAKERGFIVNGVVNARAIVLARQRVYPSQPITTLAGGRLLVLNPAMAIRGSSLVQETRGFLNAHNVPGWDTWICHHVDPEASPTEALCCWIPSLFLELTARGIRARNDNCIMWADRFASTMTNRLREALSNVGDPFLSSTD